ncbi:hypothetical protein [Vulgatibacter sp.]|uniref:hypothetical protein n=1 Tax=Vulgatibacter sp. TaxID=1971226 RepID=UPI00356396B3
MSDESQTPSWLLISVLFSTVPLSAALSMTLHEAAWNLLRTDAGVGDVAGDLISGKVRNLKKDFVLGTLAGPGFEAEVDTERGSGLVRFLLTRQGIEAMEEREQQKAWRPRYLN